FSKVINLVVQGFFDELTKSLGFGRVEYIF
ncbi:MAG: hypothetical protein ACI9FB_004235, partial [Candidatus Azotimanducaceae bacterium]